MFAHSLVMRNEKTDIVNKKRSSLSSAHTRSALQPTTIVLHHPTSLQDSQKKTRQGSFKEISRYTLYPITVFYRLNTTGGKPFASTFSLPRPVEQE